MRKISKYIVISAALALLITVFAVVLIMYDMRLFEISFIDRGEAPVSVDTDAPATRPDDSTAPEGTETDAETDPGDDTKEGETDAPDIDVYEKIYADHPVSDGKEAIEDIYDGQSMALYRLDGVKLPEEAISDIIFTRKRFSVKINKKNDRDPNMKREFTEYDAPEMRYSADVYMGYLVITEKKSLLFYNGAGRLVYRHENGEELGFAYERDKEGRPLFTIGEQYYYIDEQAGALAESDFDIRDSRGLRYNYPTDFGISAGQLKANRDGDRYGFVNDEGEQVRRMMYSEAYNFSEGLGFITYDGDYCYINEDFKVVLDDFYKVVRTDENGIGSIYFDGGYVMVRVMKEDIRDNVVMDMDILVDTQGKAYPLPDGYAAVSYSNERILVENGGKYGFYAVKGAWITDCVYSYATPYYEGLAVVGDISSKGVIDLDGNFVIPQSYSHISVCSGGIIVCYSQQTGFDVYIKALK